MRFKVFYQLPGGERGSADVHVPSWENKTPVEREAEAEDLFKEVCAGAVVNYVEPARV